MDIKRCFEILEVSTDASYEEAKSAYRIMCQVWHPDKYTHSEQLQAKATSKIKEINAAWSQIEDYFQNGAAKARNAKHQATEEREKSQRTEQERKHREAKNEKENNQQPKQEQQTTYRPNATKSSNSVYKILISLIAVLVVAAVFSGKKQEVPPVQAPAPAVFVPGPVDVDPHTGNSSPASVSSPTTEVVNPPSPQYQLEKQTLNSADLSSNERIALSSACFAAQQQGPASYNKCVSQQLSAMDSDRPDTSNLSSNERIALSSACFAAQQQGPASYNKCVRQQLSAMSPERPDTSDLSSNERIALSSACFTAQQQGPASYNRCVSQQLSAMGSDRPDTSNLSSNERIALSSACFAAQQQGLASYNQCVRQQLSTMGR